MHRNTRSAARRLDTALFCLALTTIAAIGQAPPAEARDFTFLYQTTPLERGEHEYEQWVTWTTDKDADPDYDRFEFRQEFEHGVTDNLQFAFYLATWRTTRTGDGRTTAIHDTAVELLYSLSDAETSPLGAALYGEVKLDSELFELEGKILLEKLLGPWVLAYNGVIEAEWEEEGLTEKKGEVAQLLGVSRRISPRWSLGGEMLYEVEIADWSEVEDGVIYAGPNVALRGETWWTTVTAMTQLTDSAGAPNLKVRVLVGKPF